MTLMLHTGGELVTVDQLQAVATPEPTSTHVPIPHHHLYQVVKHWLSFYGHHIAEEHHAIAKDGARYFGLLTLRSDYSDYSDTLIMRNSHDKAFSLSIGAGSRCFCCDNLAFIADHTVSRKHGARLRHLLPSLISELVEPLAQQRALQHRKLTTYKNADIDDMRAHDGILRMFQRGVINQERIPRVLGQWHNPDHDWGEKSVWRLFNACTYALAGRIAEDPSTTTRLHEICDEIVEA